MASPKIPDMRSFLVEAVQLLGGQVRDTGGNSCEIAMSPPAMSPPGTRDLDDPEETPAASDGLREEAAESEVLQASESSRHPAVQAVTGLILKAEARGDGLRPVLVAPDGSGQERLLILIEHAAGEVQGESGTDARVLSRQQLLIEIDGEGEIRLSSGESCQGLRELGQGEGALAEPLWKDWTTPRLEEEALAYAQRETVPRYLKEVHEELRKLADRLTAAFRSQLEAEGAGAGEGGESFGGASAPGADPLGSFTRQVDECVRGRDLVALPPLVKGSALVVPESTRTRAWQLHQSIASGLLGVVEAAGEDMRATPRITVRLVLRLRKRRVLRGRCSIQILGTITTSTNLCSPLCRR